MFAQHTFPSPTVPQNKATLTYNAHLAPLAVIEQDGHVHLLHCVTEAIQRRFHRVETRMLECWLSVVMGTGRRRNATNQRSPCNSTSGNESLYTCTIFTSCASSTCAQSTPQLPSSRTGVQLLRVVDVTHRAVCGRVAEVVADSGHQKVFRESLDMLSGTKRGKDIREQLLRKPCCCVEAKFRANTIIILEHVVRRILFIHLLQYAQV